MAPPRAARRRDRHRRRPGLHGRPPKPDDRPDRHLAGHRRPPAGHLHRHVHAAGTARRHRRRPQLPPSPRTGAQRHARPGAFELTRPGGRGAARRRHRRGTVTLTGQGRDGTARTANPPAARTVSPTCPPAYTITFQRTGSPDLTLAITLLPGANPQPDAALEQPSGISGQVRVTACPSPAPSCASTSRRRPARPTRSTRRPPRVDRRARELRGARHPAGQYIIDAYINGQIQPPHSRPRSARPSDRARRLRHQHRAPATVVRSRRPPPPTTRPRRPRNRVAAACVDPTQRTPVP